MSLYHAVVFVDHESAEVLQFDSESVLDRKIHEHRHFTRQHAAVEGIAEVLVAGRHTGIADFRHDVDKHRPLTAARIVGYEVVDHPTENQLVALGRKHFAKYDGTPGTARRAAD